MENYPVLYEMNPPDGRTEEEYHSSWGIGVLVDTIQAVVREERNGAYELNIRYKSNGRMARELKIGRWIKANVTDEDRPAVSTRSAELFRIYDIQRNISGEILLRCEHKSYRINGVYCHQWLSTTNWDGSPRPPSNMSPYSLKESVYAESFKPDKKDKWGINTYVTFDSSYPRDEVPIRFDVKEKSFTEFLLRGTDSIIGQWGGEVERIGNNIRFKKTLSNQKEGQWYRLDYSTNLQSLDLKYSFADVATHIVPHVSLSLPFNINEAKSDKEWSYTNFNYFDHNNSIVLRDSSYTPVFEKYGFIKVSPVDFRFHEDHLTRVWIGNGAGESIPSRGDRLKAELKMLANHWVSYMKPHMVNLTCTVDIIALWNTEEFKILRGIERLRLGDYCQVIHPDIHFPVRAKVVATEFDVMLNRFTKIDISANYEGADNRIELPAL